MIEQSVSPWASPIVIVPKRTAPGELPKRRLCIDYHALNSPLPPVKKAHSKAKGVLILVPLPKIDEIYAHLQGSRVYSTLDMRSGYHHLVLILCSSQTRLQPLPVQTQGMQLLKVFIQFYYNNSHQQYENEVSHSSMFKISML